MHDIAQIGNIPGVTAAIVELNQPGSRIEQQLCGAQSQSQRVAQTDSECLHVPFPKLLQHGNDPRVIGTIGTLLNIEQVILIKIDFRPLPQRRMTINHILHDGNLIDGIQTGIHPAHVHRPVERPQRSKMVTLTLLHVSDRRQLFDQIRAPCTAGGLGPLNQVTIFQQRLFLLVCQGICARGRNPVKRRKNRITTINNGLRHIDVNGPGQGAPGNRLSLLDHLISLISDRGFLPNSCFNQCEPGTQAPDNPFGFF